MCAAGRPRGLCAAGRPRGLMLALHAKMLAVFSRSRQAHTREQRAAISEQARHPGLTTGCPLRRSCATVAHVPRQCFAAQLSHSPGGGYDSYPDPVLLLTNKLRTCTYVSCAAADAGAELAARCYDSRSGGVFGTLTYPHLILPYSAYYGRLAAHYGGPRCSPITCWCDKRHLQVPEPPIYNKMVGLPVLSVLTMMSLHTKPPPYDFLNLYEACLQAPRTPK